MIQTLLAVWAAHAEAFFWVAAQLALGVMGAALWPRLRPQAGTAADGVATAGRWLYALALPYLALLLGSLSARDMGLVGLDAQPYGLSDWLPALAWAAAWGVAAGGLYAWGRIYPGATPGNALLDECRWAFYRGAALGWVAPGLPTPSQRLLGVLLGLGLAALEWGLLRSVRLAAGEPVPPAAGTFARAWLSAFVFLFSRNLWVTVAVGFLVPWGLAQWRARHG